MTQSSSPEHTGAHGSPEPASTTTPNPLAVLAAGFGVGLLYWFFDGVYDYFTFADQVRTMLFEEPLGLADALVLNIPRDDLIARLGFLAASVAGAYGTFLFLRRQARLSESLRHSEERFRFLSESATEGILVHDGEKLLLANKTLEDIFGGFGSTGTPVLDVINRHVAPESRDLILEKATSTDAQHYEIQHLTPEGEIMHCEIVSRSSLYQGRPVRSVSIIDITARKRAEQALEAERNLLRTVMDNTTDMIFVKDMEHRFLLANAAFAAFVDAPSTGDLVGRKADDVLPRNLALALRPQEDEVMNSGMTREDVEELWTDNHGAHHWISSTKTPLRTVDGDIVGLVAVLRDVSDRKERERAESEREAAQAASEAKSAYLARMSHEIRTPLNAIVGVSDLLRETRLDPEQDNLVRVFQASSELLTTLVDDILDLSRIEAGKARLSPKAFDLHAMADQTVQAMAPSARRDKLDLVLDIAPDTPQHVVGDPVRLRQILVNLIGNAVKFTPKGEIVLTVQPDEPRESSSLILFSVRDTGLGIPANKQQTVFDSFTQPVPSKTGEMQGTGLGLAIVRRLSALMGGRVWLESTEGRGSTFHFTARLPRYVPSETDHSEKPPRLRDKRILVCNASLAALEALEHLLSVHGAEVLGTTSWEKALQLAEQARTKGRPLHGAVLDDSALPMPGQEACAVLHGAAPDCRCILLCHGNHPGFCSDMSAQTDVFTCIASPPGRTRLLDALDQEGTPGAFVPLVPLEPTDRGSLPGSDAAVQGSKAPPVTAPAKPVTTRILLAEDAVNNRLLMELYFKDTGHKLDMAENGAIALEKFAANDYDMVFMDLQMPVLNGYEATRAIRQMEIEQGRPSTPVVALTAHAFTEARERSLAAGCTAYMTKPVKRSAVLEAVNFYCGQRH